METSDVPVWGTWYGSVHSPQNAGIKFKFYLKFKNRQQYEMLKNGEREVNKTPEMHTLLQSCLPSPWKIFYMTNEFEMYEKSKGYIIDLDMTNFNSKTNTGGVVIQMTKKIFLEQIEDSLFIDESDNLKRSREELEKIPRKRPKSELELICDEREKIDKLLEDRKEIGITWDERKECEIKLIKLKKRLDDLFKKNEPIISNFDSEI
jgi:hypothetical protein